MKYLKCLKEAQVSKDKQTSISQQLNITMACVWNARPRCTNILLKNLETSLYQLLQFCIDWIVCKLKQMLIWLSDIVYAHKFLLQNFITYLNTTSNSSTLTYTNFNCFNYASTLTYNCFEKVFMSNNGLI